MTDHHNTATPARGCDPSLVDFVSNMDSTPPEEPGVPDTDGQPLVLTVAGTLIRGFLIPAHLYVKQSAAVIADEMGGDPDAIEYDRRTEALRLVNAAGDDDAPEHLHLRAAQHLTPAGWWPTSGLLWRGRIEAVSGWAYDTTNGEPD